MISMTWDMGVNMAIMVLECLFVAGSDINGQVPPSTVKVSVQCTIRCAGGVHIYRDCVELFEP
jgi:hypothetical protein